MKNITIYTIDYCPFCKNALRFLDSRGLEYNNIVVESFECSEFLNLSRKTGMQTLPQIFIDEKLIGGYTDMKKLDMSGKLDNMLQ